MACRRDEACTGTVFALGFWQEWDTSKRINKC